MIATITLLNKQRMIAREVSLPKSPTTRVATAFLNTKMAVGFFLPKPSEMLKKLRGIKNIDSNPASRFPNACRGPKLGDRVGKGLCWPRDYLRLEAASLQERVKMRVTST
jgi:hypothetical protein